MPCDLPVPDHLLVPLLEVAADTLRASDTDDVPPALRHLHGFDRRGLMHGPGPRQLRAALVRDEAFAARVIEAFTARPSSSAVLDAWRDGDPADVVAGAAARHDLPTLASVLWACTPPRAEFGLGLVVERDAQERRARGDAAADRARDRQLDELTEARRRADEARLAAEAEAAQTASKLRDERAARRAREERAEADAAEARRRVTELERLLAAVREELEAERVRAAREAGRVRAVQDEVARLRAELTAAAEQSERSPSRLDARDTRALAEAAAAAHRAATILDTLARTTAMQGAPGGARPARSMEKPLDRRVQPHLPSGVLAESPGGLDAMLRTPDAVLIIDGYNVTKRGWPEASAADQRERLGIAATALNRRLGCRVLLVFDGDGITARPGIRRGDVRVVFSDAGEEADEVVVREVAALPKRVPVVVASSDAWVREHARANGAVVVGADALVALVKAAR